MGVTLERVQNKFACIIGELSNEPDIMSQFAIWVDLRIAEYKAKGAISLDCSGASPNPVWLRGFRPMKYESTERNFLQSSPAPVPMFEKNPVNFLQSSLEDNDNSLWENAGVSLNSPLRSESPDLVMWDDERSQPSSETAIAHQRYSANPVQRPASETFTGRNHYPRARSLSDETFMPSPPKISKFERNSEHLTNEPKVYAMPGSRQTKPVVQPEVSIVLDNAEHNTTTPFNLAQTTPPKKTVQPAHPSPLKLVSSGSESTAAINSPSSTTTGTSIFPADACEEAEYKFPTLINHPRLRHVKSRFPNLRGRSPNVMNRIAGSVAIFDCWLRDTQHEMRNMEEIPPKQLDDYLVKFLPVVKKVNGDDFDPESFKNIWVRLELFLNENSYSESIRKSRLFSRSQDAFAKKFRYLALKSAEKLQIKYQPP